MQCHCSATTPGSPAVDAIGDAIFLGWGGKRESERETQRRESRVGPATCLAFSSRSQPGASRHHRPGHGRNGVGTSLHTCIHTLPLISIAALGELSVLAKNLTATTITIHCCCYSFGVICSTWIQIVRSHPLPSAFRQNPPALLQNTSTPSCSPRRGTMKSK